MRMQSLANRGRGKDRWFLKGPLLLNIGVSNLRIVITSEVTGPVLFSWSVFYCQHFERARFYVYIIYTYGFATLTSLEKLGSPVMLDLLFCLVTSAWSLADATPFSWGVCARPSCCGPILPIFLRTSPNAVVAGDSSSGNNRTSPCCEFVLLSNSASSLLPSLFFST